MNERAQTIAQDATAAAVFTKGLQDVRGLAEAERIQPDAPASPVESA